MALEEFMNDRFRGIIRVSIDTISAEAIMVSAEYTAYFFKMLLTYIYGRTFLNMDIKSEDKALIMTITTDEDLPLTDSERRFLIKTARNAGMEIYPSERKIKLLLRFSKAAYRRVYAVSVFDGRRVILAKLNEIFYCGAPYSTKENHTKRK